MTYSKDKQRDYCKSHYEKNKEAYALRHKLRKSLTSLKLIEIKSSTPCADCGIQYPHWIMDFDHINGIKVNHISQMKTASWDKIQEEINKCELVCSNCHRNRTYQRSH